MLRQCVALLLISSFLGLCSPVFAGDLDSKIAVAPGKMKSVSAGFGRLHLTSGLNLTPARQYFAPKIGLPSGYAFGLPQSAPQSPPPPKQLTRTGKILEWVGIGLMGEGA